ncbi:hypothetical protein ACR42D_04770 [Desulfovibrio caledoniensis]
MLKLLVGIICFVSFIVTLQSQIREHRSGKEALEKLSKAGLCLLRWRGYASYKSELVHIRRFTGYLAVISTILFYSLGRIANVAWLAPAPLLFLFAWVSLKDGLKFVEIVKKDSEFIAICIASPWLYLLIQKYTGFESGIFYDFARFATLFGVSNLSVVESAFTLSALFCFFGVIFVVFHCLLISFIPVCILFVLVFPSIICRRLLKVQPKNAKFFFLLVHIVTTGALLFWPN